MNIVMLGHSAAGKTTYVSLMYTIMTEGIGGFSVRAKNQDDHASLTHAARAIRAGRYPGPTDQRAAFELVLRHQGSDVFPFTWRDYRGGALGEKTDSPQARELHEDLKRADGIVVFCDSLKLLTHSRAGREVRTLVSHVQRALDARGTTLTPLVLVLTKADLVDLDDEKVAGRLTEPFLPLIQAVSAAEHVLGTLTPVACGPDPFNVHIPVLWALRFGIAGRALDLQRRVEANMADAKSFAARDTLWDRFRSWANDETPAWRHAESSRQAAMAEYEKFEPLVDPANQLGEVIDGVPGF